MDVAQKFRRAKAGVLGRVDFRPHWGPGVAKIAAAAVPLMRLSFLSQRPRPVFHRRDGYNLPVRLSNMSFPKRRGGTPGRPDGSPPFS